MNIISILIIFAVLAIALVVWLALKATGGIKNSHDSDDPTAIKASNGKTSSNSSNAQSSCAPSEANTARSEQNPDKITFTGLTVIDSEQCSVKITGIDPASAWGYALKTLLTNKTGDKTYTFAVEAAAVNNVQCSPLFSKEVAAGGTADTEIDLPSADLAAKGITDFNDIELVISVYDSTDWETDGYTAKETVHIFPYGEDKRKPFVRKATAFDKILADNNKISIVAADSGYNEVGDYIIGLYLLNKTGGRIVVRADEVMVNGHSADPFYSAYISAGKSAFSSICWEKALLKHNSITEVKTIDFLLLAFDENDGRQCLSEKISLDLQK